MFIIVTMQLLRKRHIGNDIVTVIFQDPEAKPFCAKNIRSQFQHVFVVVRCLPSSDDKPVKYKYVCLFISLPVHDFYYVFIWLCSTVVCHHPLGCQWHDPTMFHFLVLQSQRKECLIRMKNSETFSSQMWALRTFYFIRICKCFVNITKIENWK